MFGLSREEIEFKKMGNALSAVIELLVEKNIITKEEFISKFNEKSAKKQKHKKEAK